MKRNKISSRIYAIVGMVVSILMIIQLFMYSFIMEAISYQRETNSSYAIKQLNSTLLGTVSLLNKFSNVICYDHAPRILQYSETEFLNRRQQISSPVTDLTDYTDELVYFALFSPTANYKLSDNMAQNEYAALKESYSRYCNSDNYNINDTYFDFFTVTENPYNEIYVSCFCPVYAYQFHPSQKVRIGTTAVYSKINLTMLPLEERIFNDMDIRLYHTRSDVSFSLHEYNSDHKGAQITKHINHPVSTTGWYIKGDLYQSTSEYNLALISYLVILEAVVVIAMFVFLFIEFRRSVSKPISRLTRYMADYELAGHQPPLIMNSNAEFDFIADQVNNMLLKNKETTKRIFTMQQNLYELELDKLKLEMQSLQSQINPHFLYNTLECIRSIALVHHISEIEKVSYALSQIMRYAAKGGLTVTLEQELHMLKTYIDIMQIRFPDYYHITIDVPEECLNHTIPKLILQPVFENIFKYANMPGARSLTIALAAKVIDHHMCISIRDSGQGIPAARLREITLALRSENIPPHHIGLYNVNRRIRLHGGEKCGLKLDSVEGEYTCVELTLSLSDI